jgi:hypothetical protein
MIAQLAFAAMASPSAKPLSAVLRASSRAKFQESAAQSAMVSCFLLSFHWNCIGRKSKCVTLCVCVCDRWLPPAVSLRAGSGFQRARVVRVPQGSRRGFPRLAGDHSNEGDRPGWRSGRARSRWRFRHGRGQRGHQLPEGSVQEDVRSRVPDGRAWLPDMQVSTLQIHPAVPQEMRAGLGPWWTRMPYLSLPARC